MPLPIQCGAFGMGNFCFHFLVQKLCALLRLLHPNFDCFILRTCNACLHMLCIIPSHTHTKLSTPTRNFMPLYQMLLWELYCAPHYTQIVCDRYYTVRQIFHSIPFIYANWLHVIASKLKSFIMSNAPCDDSHTHILILRPWNAMKWQNFEVTRQNEIRFY